MGKGIFIAVGIILGLVLLARRARLFVEERTARLEFEEAHRQARTMAQPDLATNEVMHVAPWSPPPPKEEVVDWEAGRFAGFAYTPEEAAEQARFYAEQAGQER